MNKNKIFLQFLDFFQNPHQNQQYIHIAGTKGKTSTAYYIYQMLLKMNESVGLFVSPHVFSEMERIQCYGQCITEQELTEYRKKIQFARQTLNQSLGFFDEFLLIAFLYFRDKNVKIIVLEVGIGGKLDTTNIVTPLISVISRIKKDHEQILGNTLWGMFKQKLGIVKSNIPFIIGQQNFLGNLYSYLLTLKFLKQKQKMLPYKILLVDQNTISLFIEAYSIKLIGPLYMVENFVLAYSTFKALGYTNRLTEFQHQVPGRFQAISGYAHAYIDGAHNGIAMKMLRKTLTQQFLGAKWKVVLCVREDKNIPDIISELMPITKEFIILPWNTLIKAEFNPHTVIAEIEKQQGPFLQLSKEKLNTYLEKNDNILVTGSFYHLPIIYQELVQDTPYGI